MKRVGIEVGGTFTDLVAIGPDGISVTKVPSVPHAPDEGAFNALLASGIDIASITDLAHGSTVATNAVLERKGFRTAFVTTKGFRDILALQRHGRSRIYDLEYQKPRRSWHGRRASRLQSAYLPTARSIHRWILPMPRSV